MDPTSARLQRIAAELKSAGETGIRREVLRTIRAQALPLKNAAQQAALEKLPSSGGLAAREAANVKVQVLTGARNAGVRLRNTRVGAAQTDQGYVRHPVFGNRKKWTTQFVPGARGWWTDTLEAKSPAVLYALQQSIDRLSSTIGRL